MIFSDKKIQQTFDSAKQVLDKLKENKDNISKEIKNLEDYLKQINICESISYQISNPTENFKAYDDDAVSSGFAQNMYFEGDCFDGIATEESLIWCHNRKRLIYLLKEYHNATFSIEPPVGRTYINDCEIKTIYDKPLIETPFEIRKKIYKNHLSDFLLSLAKAFDLFNDLPEEKLDPDEIPF